MSIDETPTSTGAGHQIRSFSLHYLPAIVATMAVVVFVLFMDWQKHRIHEETLRSSVMQELGLIRTRLEGNIRGNTQLVQGLVGTLETEPDMTQERLNALADRTIRNAPQIRNLALAPDLVVKMVYPLKGNEKALGLDYLKNPKQRDAALLARDSNHAIITGPVKLVQGGEGLIARFPVQVVRANGSRYVWGIVSAVMDMEKLYRDSGIKADNLPIKIAISVKNQDGIVGKPFFGDASTVAAAPVVTTVKIGFEDWIISAVPTKGWNQQLDGIWWFRSALLIGGLIIIAPMVFAGRLMKERQDNIAKLQIREDEMEALSHRLEIALETSKIGVWDFDAATGELIWDERMKVLYGINPSKAEVDYLDWETALHPDDLAEAQKIFADAIQTEGEYRTSFRVIDRGEVRHIRAIGSTYRDSLGHVKIVGVNWDVTNDIALQEELRKAKSQTELQNKKLDKARQRMEVAALHDALTDLPNRRYLDQFIAQHDLSQGAAADLTVLHIDLDRFKDINDTLGHAAGDLILKTAGAKLRAKIPQEDFLARIGGDEFVVISVAGSRQFDYLALAHQLVETISQPVDYHGHECRIGASIGIAQSSDGIETIEHVLVNADMALYEAKRKGRNRVEVFTDSFRLDAINTKKTADEILRGLENNEFIAYYQPQFDAHTLEITGMEALARWDHPTRGILGPASFLQIAEDMKVVANIDSVILEQALFQQLRLNADGILMPKVSVNISAQRLFDEAMFRRLEELSFKPGSLSFELLESVSVDDDRGELLSRIERIKALGIDLEIDDFGTGYASIISLLKLTPRRLKIDRQLIIPLLESAAQQKLVKSIIDIGNSRNIEIVAEGVETMEHVRVLRDLGCHTLQGYVLARPMSGGELARFARERAWLKGVALPA